MGTKRRRRCSSNSNAAEACKRSRSGFVEGDPGKQSNHPTLRLYYKQIFTLRNYLLSQLPNTSKKRRRRIASLGHGSEEKTKTTRVPSTANAVIEVDDAEPSEDNDGGEDSLGNLLDQTVVCCVDRTFSRDPVAHAKDVEAFSQQISLTAGSSIGERCSLQSELIDFAIWLLFHRVHRNMNRPPHMLCHGYQRARGPQQVGDEVCPVAGIPGIVSHYPNSNVSILKSTVWHDVLHLLGKEGEQVMLDVIMHCAIFSTVTRGRGNFCQLSGLPMTDLKILEPGESVNRDILLHVADKSQMPPRAAANAMQGSRKPASICFVRNRMFYARAALNTKGKVIFGLRHIHALNRYPDPNNKQHTLHLLQYIFSTCIWSA